MNEQPMLNDQEWSLVLELLEGERSQLPPEIHHTDSPQVHERLEDRLQMVESLIDRLKGGRVH